MINSVSRYVCKKSIKKFSYIAIPYVIVRIEQS